MRFSVLAEFFCGFAVLDDFFFGFAVSNTPQCPPPNQIDIQAKRISILQTVCTVCSLRFSGSPYLVIAMDLSFNCRRVQKFNYSFSPRTSRVWNQLPAEVATTQSFVGFKEKVSALL